LWFANNWDGSKTVEQTLAGGNLKVSSSSSFSTGSALTQIVLVSNSTKTADKVYQSNYGQPVTFTATVTPAVATNSKPSGTVTFRDLADDGTVLATLATVSLNSSGVASYSSSTLSSGNHNINAMYNGDSKFNTCSGEIDQNVTSSFRFVNKQPVEKVKERTVEVSAYPNPSEGEFTVKLKSFKSTKVEVVVLHSNGSIVERQTLQIGGEYSTVNFDLRNQPSGTYMVKVVSEDGVQMLTEVIYR
jgi:hypothetical protein